MELDQHKRPGFRIKDYFISFPEGEFVHENDDGTMSLDIDIFRIDGNNNLVAMDEASKDAEIEALRPEIEAWVNTALEEAIKRAEEEHK
jgi:hypothetical protein